MSEEKPDLRDKQPTPEDFITRWPLYTPFAWEDFTPPERISFLCEGTCAKETTWARGGVTSAEGTPSNSLFYWVKYQCNLCGARSLIVMYRSCAWETRTVNLSRRSSGLNAISRTPPPPPVERSVVTKVQKIGQIPALSISIPKGLEKNLGAASASMYKKALISRNQGYGLAAVTYLRRVVEDKTDELIDVVAQVGEAHGVETEIVNKIRAAKSERTTYDSKLKLASTVLPASITPDGANPLGILYDLVSEGIHDLSEERCIEVADRTRDVFEFTFTHLRAETTGRQSFVAKVKELASGKKKAEKG